MIAALLAVAAASTSGALSNERRPSLSYEPAHPVTVRVTRDAPQTQAPAAPTVKQPVPQAPIAVARSTPPKAERTDEAPPGVIRVWHVMYAATRSTTPRSTASSAPCPKATTCDKNSVRRGRWPTDDSGRAVIRFAYNDEGRRPARAADGLARPSLAAAMNEWTRWNSNIVFSDEGPTDATFGADGPDGTCADGTNVITWEKFAPEVIGAAVICFDRTGKVIRDADLALNATQHWERMADEAESRHSHDIQAIYTHELGHWLSLEDLYAAESSRQTMHGGTQYEEFHKRTLALGDIAGLQKAYPCAGEDRCPRSGIRDD